MQIRRTGIIRSYDKENGFGFILMKDEQDIFFSNIDSNLDFIKEGDNVCFYKKTTNIGIIAVEIISLSQFREDRINEIINE